MLHEWAAACNRTMSIEESSVPVSDVVRGACELLGLDPMHSPNEGTLVAAVPTAWAEQALAALRGRRDYEAAALIGTVERRTAAPVVVRRGANSAIPLDEPLGAPLPRIC